MRPRPCLFRRSNPGVLTALGAAAALSALCSRNTNRTLRLLQVFLTDTCVPISKLAEIIAETEAAFKEANLPCIICAHIADGNFHCCVPYKVPSRLVATHRTRLSGVRANDHRAGGCSHTSWR